MSYFCDNSLRTSCLKIPSEKNKIDNNSDDQLLIIQATTEANKQYYDEKIKDIIEDLIETITSMMYQIKFSESSPDNNYSPKDQDPTTVVPDKKKAPPVEGGNSTKHFGMYTLKH